MARKKGMSYTQTFNNMASNPIYQQRWANVANQGQDKRAISNINKIIGADVAGEMGRLHSAAQAGEELARRDDKLGFNKKVQDFKAEQFNKRLEQDTLAFEEEQERQMETFDWNVLKAEADREWRQQQHMDDIAFRQDALSSRMNIEQAKIDMDKSTFGMEFALGLFSTGAEVLGDYNANKYRREEESLINKRNATYDAERKYWLEQSKMMRGLYDPIEEEQ